MDKLFKNLWEKSQCQKNGICSLNPILNALDAVIVNELRQIAFYIVHLNELNFYNEDVMHQTIEALSAVISDSSYSENALINFYANVKTMKHKVFEFYKKKSLEMNVSYEFITSRDENLNGNNSTELIKAGEKIIKLFYNGIKEEKSRLINLIVVFCKTSAINLSKLAVYKKPEKSYYFEILRLLSLTNYTGTRKDKFLRRIYEFSNVAYKIQEELTYAVQEKFGKRQTGSIDTSIRQGHCVFVSGGDLNELYDLAIAAPDLNLYYDASMAAAVTYPKFQKLPNLKGLWGTGDAEFDFANFKGAIYLTKNSSMAIDTAFRGKIFTTKTIPSDRSIKIEKNNFKPLIDAAKEIQGFHNTILNRTITFEYDFRKYENFINTNRNKKILISMGETENFNDGVMLKFDYPNEIQGLFNIINLCERQNTSVYFANCTQQTIDIICSILSKNLHKIYLKSCQTQIVNPHITNCLEKDFGVEII